MDKHDRPYKCNEPGCDKVQGFTYSGGLLRHQREVHKMNQSTAIELYCQYANCDRSTRPFTRSENLREHNRRRHVPAGGMISPVTATIPTPMTPLQPTQERSRKRKRTATDVYEDPEVRQDDSDGEGQFEQVKRLRSIIALKDDTIAQKDQVIVQRDGTIAQKDQVIVQRDGTIRQLRAELAAIRQHLSTLRSQVQA
jgi:hypothetical protein